MTTIGWLDCSSGVSGDMLLGALTELDALDATALPARLRLDAAVTVTPVTRGGIGATRVTVTAAIEQPPRRLSDILTLIDDADLPAPVAERARSVFRRLTAAEAAVHRSSPEEVHVHEVGAVDAVVDVAGSCLGLYALGLDRLVVSSVALGGGRTNAAHGSLPVPAPAVVELLTGCGLTAHGGPDSDELATPTGTAVLAEWATGAGPLPEMTVKATGVGAGGRDLPGHPNVLRLLVGTAVADSGPAGLLLVEANVDDLDPRLWPGVLDRLLAAGALDAWLTPILMKKGRPAHTVAALVPGASATAIRDVLLAETSTIGVRESPVTKHALARSWLTVDVCGVPVRVKIAGIAGRHLNVAPEFEDVAAAAARLGRPAKDVLARATAAAVSRLDER